MSRPLARILLSFYLFSSCSTLPFLPLYIIFFIYFCIYSPLLSSPSLLYPFLPLILFSFSCPLRFTALPLFFYPFLSSPSSSSFTSSCLCFTSESLTFSSLSLSLFFPLFPSLSYPPFYSSSSLLHV